MGLAGRALAAGALVVLPPAAAWAQSPAAGQGQTVEAGQAVRQFNIAAQPLGEAVMVFAQQAGIDLFVGKADLRDLQASPLVGQFTVTQALDVLLSGSGVGYRYAAPRDGGRLAVQLYALPAASRVSVHALPEVVVVGRIPEDQWVYQTPRAVSVITREQMDRTPARHAADLIQDTPGVASAVNRLNPGLSVNIRGMQDFGRVNMMIDGMRQNFVQTGHMQRNGEMFVDSELLSSVVVERGPRSDVHGLGAIGGSVNFRTLDFDDVLREGQHLGFRLRANTGLGNAGNGVNFIGSAAGAARVGERVELLAAYARRSFGDYEIGSRGANHNTAWQDGELAAFNDVKYASQRQNSSLFKARWNLDGGQSLQFSYVGTQVGYQNTTDADLSMQQGGTVWRSLGSSRVQSQGYSLDYRLQPPGNNLIDLNLKLYSVDTRNRNYTDPTYPRSLLIGSGTVPLTDPELIRLSVDGAWERGNCEGETVADSVRTACGYGLGSDHRIRTKTHGMQLDNTSRLPIGEASVLRVNYGGEYYTDRASSSIGLDHKGRAVPSYNPYGQGVGLNPKGKRDMGGLFANVTFENEVYTLSAGLRYDRYWLKGDTQVPGTQHEYVDRFQRYMARFCPGTSATQRRACEAGRTGGEAGAAAFMEANDRRGYWNNPNLAPQWTQRQGMYESSVDRSEGKLLPSLAAAVRPTSWLELYGTWGRSWRPPAINESLMVGAHPGDNASVMYPNPNADPETTRSWELGVNTQFQDVFTRGDRLSAKLGYFDTRAYNYLYSSLENNLPGTGTTVPFGFGKVAFVNNRNVTNFRGLEFEGHYDAGWIYAGLSYTHYLGGANKFCQDLYFAGAGSSVHDQPNEDGSYPQGHQDALAAGYPSWEAWVNDMIVCRNNVFNSAIAKPVDKGAAVLGVRMFERKLDTGVRFTYSGNGYYNRETGGAQTWFRYTTWDWFASYQATKQIKLMAAVENVTDRMYRDGYSDALARTYAPGRTVQVGMEIHF
ncbi:Hemophore HasA outer membrane receptor HasR / Iron siderophore receptor protein [plant metagenome]|uniref:Hemophore HasA outer membrane receptor HasR / Iron siderophore receptor protein n=1 Tax=plant metagenome TaxID=1297885 RepID=A0A484U011_9ZZZZ